MALESQVPAPTSTPSAPNTGVSANVSSWQGGGIADPSTIRRISEIYARTLPATSFLRFRPAYHLMASHAWMGGPCGAGFDPSTGLYHISYQWNPRNNRWGHITWGHAISKDLISWDVPASPILEPDRDYDSKGIFMGCMVPRAVDGRAGVFTVFYTSANHLPIHYTLKYEPGCETLSFAESEDGGQTWKKSARNPILPGPPANLTVWSWRDPFITTWQSLSRLLGYPPDALYGLLSGGLSNRTPTVFLYSLDSNDLAKWTYISSLINFGLNYRTSRFSGDMGKNWEVANLITLSDDTGVERDFIVTGADGCQPIIDPLGGSSRYEHQVPRSLHSQQWICGTLALSHRRPSNIAHLLNTNTSATATASKPSIQVSFDYHYGGTLDHGDLYATTSFLDPQSQTHILWGWITEGDLPQKVVDSQNWSGLLSLPREVKLLRYEHVTGTLSTPLEDISCMEIERETTTDNPEPTYTIRTLGIFPAKATAALRRQALPVTPAQTQTINTTFLPLNTTRWELHCEMSLTQHCTAVGLRISHTPDHRSRTEIHFSPVLETLTISRPNAADIHPQVNTRPKEAPFTLFRFAGSRLETLRLHAFFDESVLELFVNGRVAFSTRVYPPTKRCFGVRFFAEGVVGHEDVRMGHGDGDGDGEVARLLEARAWDGLRADMRIVGRR